MAVFTGSVNFNDVLTGTASADSFLPFTSFDITTGDIVNGGGGQDTLVLDYSAQATGIGIVSTGGLDGSFSTNLSKVSYTSIERFNITGTKFADVIMGGAFADTLLGGAGGDVIDGFAGTDNIDGGSGDDILRGGDGNDVITGGDGNDVLNGGNGIDNMTGGLGNDIYIVDFSGSVNGLTEQVIENSGEGYDTVISTANISSLYSNVEGLILTEGSAAVVGNGNGEDNKIQGNSNNNSLSGLAGSDQLFGGAGNDQLLGGNGLDFLYGEAGNDVLVGGSGSDRLTGGGGRDIFRIDVLESSTDIIYDFSVIDDLIEISKSVFGLSLPLGTLSANNFVLGSRPSDANDFFLYDAANGKLAFDSDGSGAGLSTVIAVLTTNPSLSNSSIRIIA